MALVKPQKVATRIWIPLLQRFERRIEDACFRRDAFLAKVLRRELPELDSEISEPNSEAAQRFIAARLDALPRKIVTLTLPPNLVQQLDDICERKRIVRDSFFNRLLFLLAADARTIDRIFFRQSPHWLSRVLERTDFAVDAAAERLIPIPDVDDPFGAIRLGLAVSAMEDEEEFGPSPAHRLGRIYGNPLTDKTFPNEVDLYGLNVHLTDYWVPGTEIHEELGQLLGFDD